MSRMANLTDRVGVLKALQTAHERVTEDEPVDATLLEMLVAGGCAALAQLLSIHNRRAALQNAGDLPSINFGSMKNSLLARIDKDIRENKAASGLGSGDCGRYHTASPQDVIEDPVSGRRELSPRKLAANRENSLRSTGPRTRAGELVVRRNAIKHGLAAEQVVAFSKDEIEQFDQFEGTLRGWLAGQERSEAELVHRVAAAVWKLQRCSRYRRSQLSTARSEDQGVPLLRYERAATRKLQKLVREVAQERNSKGGRR